MIEIDEHNKYMYGILGMLLYCFKYPCQIDRAEESFINDLDYQIHYEGKDYVSKKQIKYLQDIYRDLKRRNKAEMYRKGFERVHKVKKAPVWFLQREKIREEEMKKGKGMIKL